MGEYRKKYSEYSSLPLPPSPFLSLPPPHLPLSPLSSLPPPHHLRPPSLTLFSLLSITSLPPLLSLTSLPLYPSSPPSLLSLLSLPPLPLPPSPSPPSLTPVFPHFPPSLTYPQRQISSTSTRAYPTVRAPEPVELAAPQNWSPP